MTQFSTLIRESRDNPQKVLGWWMMGISGKITLLSALNSFNPNRAEIFSHLIHAGGGGESNWTPPSLSPAIVVIKGQTKKQMIKFYKKTNFEQFFNGFYRQKPLFILMLLEGAFFIQLISNFRKRPDFLFVTKFRSTNIKNRATYKKSR